MRSRKDLHECLVQTFPKLPIYYQPPASMAMSFPCIVYELVDVRSERANGVRYRTISTFSVTLITASADPEEFDQMLDKVPYTEFDRSFRTQGQYHYTFKISLL